MLSNFSRQNEVILSLGILELHVVLDGAWICVSMFVSCIDLYANEKGSCLASFVYVVPSN